MEFEPKIIRNTAIRKVLETLLLLKSLQEMQQLDQNKLKSIILDLNTKIDDEAIFFYSSKILKMMDEQYLFKVRVCSKSTFQNLMPGD